MKMLNPMEIPVGRGVNWVCQKSRGEGTLFWKSRGGTPQKNHVLKATKKVHTFFFGTTLSFAFLIAEVRFPFRSAAFDRKEPFLFSFVSRRPFPGAIPSFTTSSQAKYHVP